VLKVDSLKRNMRVQNFAMTNTPVVGIILAAGKSSRMGCQKLLLPFGKGDTVLGKTISNAQAANIDPLLVVSGSEREQVEAIAAAKGVSCVFNPDYRQGQSSSIKRGLSALPSEAAALFMLADQPAVGPDVLRRLVEAYKQHGSLIVATRTKKGVSGAPTLFAPSLFNELKCISGDVGGRGVLRAHADEVFHIDIDDDTILWDADSPEQYVALCEKFGYTGDAYAGFKQGRE
jgi:molybdenum cofactor cytidylyltransferase